MLRECSPFVPILFNNLEPILSLYYNGVSPPALQVPHPPALGFLHLLFSLLFLLTATRRSHPSYLGYRVLGWAHPVSALSSAFSLSHCH